MKKAVVLASVIILLSVLIAQAQTPEACAQAKRDPRSYPNLYAACIKNERNAPPPQAAAPAPPQITRECAEAFRNPKEYPNLYASCRNRQLEKSAAASSQAAASIPPAPAPGPPMSGSKAVVCDDGKRYILASFSTEGLTEQNISRIQNSLAVDECSSRKRLMVTVVDASPTDAPAGVAVERAAPAAAATAIQQATQSAVPSADAAKTTPAKPACSESGSCYGDTSAATGKPKTVYVPGYYRKDGTYVRGYYRSK